MSFNFKNMNGINSAILYKDKNLGIKSINMLKNKNRSLPTK